MMAASVATALTAVVLAGCGWFPADEDALIDTAWHAVLVAGQNPVVGREPTMAITDDGARGNAGCNRWGSDPIRVSSGALDMGNVGITERACDDAAVARIEQLFYDAIWRADRIRLEGDRLILSGPGGEIVFEPGMVGNLDLAPGSG